MAKKKAKSKEKVKHGHTPEMMGKGKMPMKKKGCK